MKHRVLSRFHMKSFAIVASLFIAVVSTMSGAAHAQVEVYRASNENAGRYNPANSNLITFSTAFVGISGQQNALDITNLIFGVRRVQSGGIRSAFGVEFYVAPMTFDGTNYGIGAPNFVGDATVASDTLASGTQTFAIFYPNNQSRPLVLLETESQPGFGGLFYGVRFVGANATDTNNGIRGVGVPTIGTTLNQFYNYNTTSNTLSAPITSGPTLLAGQNRLFGVIAGNRVIVPEAGTLTLAGLSLLPIGMVALVRRNAKRKP